MVNRRQEQRREDGFIDYLFMRISSNRINNTEARERGREN
jgi:hypothetical protein